MRIETIQLSSFKDAPYNPRLDLQPGQPAYEKLNQSIIDFGFLQPIVVNEQTRHIISGHQRAKILRGQGITETQAVIVNFSLEKEKAANLALNKLSGGWDLEKLAHVLSELQAMPDFDMASTGFDVAEVSEILDGLVPEKDGDDFDFDAAVNDIEKPITKRGDVIELNGHRLVCGDSADPNDLKLLMGNEKADMLFTDPPLRNFVLSGGPAE
ncbi:MAG: DNA modification methylase [Candidatus Omnitrophica bacterium]|nr:DNA modification methylase [Candidatus Omnitrophota bacterium]